MHIASMVYLKHFINWAKYLFEKYVLVLKDPKYPVLLKLSPETIYYIKTESKNTNQSIEDVVNKILKEITNEIENKRRR